MLPHNSRLHDRIEISAFLANLTSPLVIREKWLRRPINIKETNKQTKIYLRRPLTLHIFCFILIVYA